MWLLVAFLFASCCHAQRVSLQGRVVDSFQRPILNATVYSKSVGLDKNLQFSISDANGKYELNLKSDEKYVVTINYLGFKEIKDTLTLSGDLVKEYTLFELQESLDEIILNKKLAVVVKEDTIIYRTNQFINGRERKLSDVLKKLPGLDVDREGNVTVNGKDVTKLMVDGKKFFNGDEKLGVNNIPADAIDEVVALDNYTDIPWLKGLTDSDQLALDIRLKDGKKNFVFGDVKTAGGIDDRYKFNSALFYYSPKTAVNLIGDINNIGVRSFTANDYLNFELGDATITQDYSQIGDILNDDVSQTLSATEFRDLQTIFGALNINHDFKSGLNVTAYTVNNNGDQETRNEQTINYLLEDDFIENRSTTSNQEQFFTANTIKLNYTTDTELDILGRFDYKDFSSDYSRNIQSQSPFNNQFNDIDQNSQNYSLTSRLNLNKRFNAKNITTLESRLKFEDRNRESFNLFNQRIFPDLVPLIDQDSGVFNVNQFSDQRTSEFIVGLKHYYVINSTTHLYPNAGIKITDLDFFNQDLQILDSDLINDFLESGFNNDLESSVGDYHIGLQLKKKYGKLVLKPGIEAHYYKWDAQQMQLEIVNESKQVLLPEFLAEYKPSNDRKWRFKYNMSSQFANPINFANRLRINTFNQISRGSGDLENTLSHNLSLGYTSFELLQGRTFSVFLSYRNFIEGIRSSTAIDGVDRVLQLIQTSLPENAYNARLNYSNFFWDLKWSYTGTVIRNDYSRIINNRTFDYNSTALNNKVEIESRFKKGINFEIEVGHSYNNLTGANISNNFENWNTTGLMEFNFLKSLLFTVDYDLNYFKNNSTNQSNNFNTVNAALEYWKESTAWTFKLEAINLFDNDSKLSNNINQFQATENRVFVQPRILLLSISYKL